MNMNYLFLLKNLEIEKKINPNSVCGVLPPFFFYNQKSDPVLGICTIIDSN